MFNLIICAADNSVPALLEVLFTFTVIFFLIFMDRPIYFHNQVILAAAEVCNKSSNGNLPAEFEIPESSAAKFIPEDTFLFRLMASQFLCPLPLLFRSFGNDVHDRIWLNYLERMKVYHGRISPSPRQSGRGDAIGCALQMKGVRERGDTMDYVPLVGTVSGKSRERCYLRFVFAFFPPLLCFPVGFFSAGICLFATSFLRASASGRRHTTSRPTNWSERR